MENDAPERQRVFKTSWFSKAAKKASTSDHELCVAIRQVMLGQADDLGGGVFKKRLDKNRSRSIILAKGKFYWVYEFFYAKKDRDNITQDELIRFRMLAKNYAELTEKLVTDLLSQKILDGDMS